MFLKWFLSSTVRQADAIAEDVSNRLKSTRFSVGGVMVHVEPD